MLYRNSDWGVIRTDFQKYTANNKKNFLILDQNNYQDFIPPCQWMEEALCCSSLSRNILQQLACDWHLE